MEYMSQTMANNIQFHGVALSPEAYAYWLTRVCLTMPALFQSRQTVNCQAAIFSQLLNFAFETAPPTPHNAASLSLFHTY